MLEDDPVGHIVVFGLHGIARRVIKQLATTGMQLIVVDPAATPEDRDELLRWDVEYLAGSGQSTEILRTARVAHALAVICVTDEDLINIEIALLVREMSTTVRVVVQMGNVSVARALEPVARPGGLFDVAELATTSFVEAVLGQKTHELTLGGQKFLVTTFTSERSGTFRSIWGDMTPVAVVPAAGGPPVSCPSRGAPVESGDLVTLMGTAEEFAAIGMRPKKPRATESDRPLRRRAREALAAFSDTLDTPFRIVFGVLVMLAVTSVPVLYRYYQTADGDQMSMLDAIYFTAETIATVGFGDFYFRDQPAGLRVWSIVLMILGAP